MSAFCRIERVKICENTISLSQVLAEIRCRYSWEPVPRVCELSHFFLLFRKAGGRWVAETTWRLSRLLCGFRIIIDSVQAGSHNRERKKYPCGGGVEN